MSTTFRHVRTWATARRFTAAAVLLTLLITSIRPGAGDVERSARDASQRRRGLELFAVPRLVLTSNQLQCTINNLGGICTYSQDLGGGGGWFPTGTPDDYIFNSGVQIAGITSADAGPWALDTAAAQFYDGRVLFAHGTALTPIYDSRDPDDLANWPDDAHIRDPDVFAPILLGRKKASQNDTWVQYWDGDPAQNRDRSHPMGIRITQRTMAWNYPSGNESVIYFVLEFENVTNDPEFQRLNELAFFGGENSLPDEGWAYDSVFVAFGVDTDVGAATENIATALLPFDMVIAYHGGFNASDFWQYPPSVFHPPFFNRAPGIVGTKYLKSPLSPDTGEEIGLSMMSVMTLFQSQPFPDPVGPDQLWRYLSGNFDLSLGDPACNIPAEIQTLSTETTVRSVCYVPIQIADVRFYQASGPFTLAPGESSTVVAAHIVAPTVATMPDGSPSGIIANSANSNANPPGVPSFHPGFASARGCDPAGVNCSEVLTAAENGIKTIERGAGWVAYQGPPPGGELYPPDVEHPSNSIDQFSVDVVPGSLLGRALVAQTVFENDFLLGFAPEPPTFYLVPGDDNVTVIWDPSSTEDEGDPFFVIASDPESALYNPNYRQFDVEGYRVWRGTKRGQLELVAQFDLEDTRFHDFTCETVHPDEDVGAQAVSEETGNLVPVIGFAAGEICPATADEPLVRRTDGSLIFNNGGPGGTPGGGVSRNPAAVAIDTAILADRDIGEVRPLADTGVPYVYTDGAVRNSFVYFYSVTAFDLNSMASGPHSLRSVMLDQMTVPREDGHNLTDASFSIYLAGDDDRPLEQSEIPGVDPETGIFSGPFPPTTAFDPEFFTVVERLLEQGATRVTIDSIQVRASGNIASGSQEFPPSATCSTELEGGRVASPFGACWMMFLTATLPDGTAELSEFGGYHPWWSAFGEPGLVASSHAAAQIPYDKAALEAFGIEDVDATAVIDWTTGEAQNYTSAEGAINRRRRHYATGARWFDGDSRQVNNAIEDPAALIRVGHLSDIDTVWAPIPYTPNAEGGPQIGGFDAQCMNRAQAFIDRAADVVWTWMGGTLHARDVTHNVDVPFHPAAGPTWGFLTTDANGNGVLDWHDFNYIERAYDIMRQVDGGSCNRFTGDRFEADGAGNAPVRLSPTPTLVPTSTEGLTGTVDLENGGVLPQTGTGFGLYAYGHRFIMEMGTQPADGTVWTLRTFKGELATDDDGAVNPTGYVYIADGAGGGGEDGGPLPALIPGLTFVWDVQSGQKVVPAWDLQNVHTVPDPYLANSQFGLSPTTKRFMFVNLPSTATIRVYSLAGVLVDQIEHDDPTGGGQLTWDLRNRSNQFIASGVYFFHVVTPAGDEHVGKFTVVIGTQ